MYDICLHTITYVFHNLIWDIRDEGYKGDWGHRISNCIRTANTVFPDRTSSGCTSFCKVLGEKNLAPNGSVISH